MKEETNETLIRIGDAVKATKLDDGNVKLSGYLVRFTDEKNLDLSGDYFDENTDFGNAIKSFSWFNHRYPVKFDDISMAYKEQLPEATLEKDKAGVLATIIIGARNEYEKMLAEMGLAGKLAWSSGTASHLVDYERQESGAWYIKRWILGLDASLTPEPAEPKNTVQPIKSLLTSEQAEVSDTDDAEKDEENKNIVEETETMDEKDLLALAESVATKTAEAMSDKIATAVEEEVKKLKPDVKAGVADIEIIEDEADKAARLNPFKTLGEMALAVKNATLYPHATDDRLKVKSSGLNEAIPSQGGFLVQQNLAAGLLEKTWSVGTVLQHFTADKIGPNSNGMLYNVATETSRVDGSRGGGVLGYWLEEGGDKTATKPEYRQISLKLKKVAAALYATDEVLADAVALESEIMRIVPTELKFKVEDAIIEGNGVGKPLGILNGGSFVSATRLNANQINTADILSMWKRRYLGANDYVWFGNADIGVYLHQMTLGNYPVYMPPGGLSQSPYGTLLGRPYIEIEYCPTLGTVGDLMLVAPSQYKLIDKGGVESASSIHVKFLQDETTFRFIYRVDGEPAWNSAVTPFKGTDTVSPFVGLAAST